MAHKYASQRRYAKTAKGKASRARAQKKWASSGGRAVLNAARRTRYAEHRKLLDDIKLERGCVDCGYNRCSSALDFDHRNPSTKKFTVCKKLAQVSDSTLLEEVAKCDVRCANCHREKTYE